MVNFEEVFGTGLENVKAAGERVGNVVRSTAKQLREALDPKALLLGGSLLVTGAAITGCNQQTPPVNHAPEADVTELVEFVQAGERRIPISDLLQMFGVEDPDGDTLSVEVISGPARIEDGYLIVNAGEDVEVKLKVSDGKGGELELTLRFDVNHPPEVQNEVVTRSVTLPEGTENFTLDLYSIVSEIGPTDPDGDQIIVSVDSVEGADGFAVDGRGTVEILGVRPGASRVVIYLKIKDSNGGETPARVEVNISWEAVDNPTQISDLSVNIVDRAVEGEPNGVHAGGMVDVEFKVDDPDGVLEVVVLVGDELETPVDLDPAGIARLSFDTSGLLVGIYPVKVRVVDGAGNEKVIDLFDLKVHPYGEIIDPDSYGDFYRIGDRRDVMRGEYLRALNTLGLREGVGLTFGGEAQLIIDGDGNDVSGAGIVVGIDPSWIVLNADGNVGIEVKRVMDRVYNEKGVVPYGTYAFRLIVTVNTDEGPVNLSFPRLVAGPFE